MRWLVDLPVSMAAIDAQQTFAAEVRTTAIGREPSLIKGSSQPALLQHLLQVDISAT